MDYVWCIVRTMERRRAGEGLSSRMRRVATPIIVMCVARFVGIDLRR